MLSHNIILTYVTFNILLTLSYNIYIYVILFSHDNIIIISFINVVS